MAEYSGVTYNLKTSRIQKDGSVEVDVQFNRNNMQRHVTFRFENESEAQAEFNNRCQNKIDKFIEKRQRIRTSEEIIDKINNYFLGNTTLSRAIAKSWFDENIDIEGAT